MHEWLHFFERTFPSANMTLIRGPRPVLIDTGFGSDFQETAFLLESVGLKPGDLQLAANTHYHADHAGGNHGLQTRHNIQIAAHRWEAALVNRRDPDACASEWLNQPVESYTVDMWLNDGDVIDTGQVQLQVIHTPGHTLGHVCYYADGVLICGDAYHANDVAWLNSFREGVGAINRTMESLDKLALLPLKVSYSGHGKPALKPLDAIDAARRRYEMWLDEPEKIGWHACKRIFTYALMLHDGMTADEIEAYLLRSHWFVDFSRHVFHSDPADFVQPLLDEIIRSRAGEWREGRLYPKVHYNPPDLIWAASVPRPRQWPK
ncbi:MAG: MBL fold metallo-hydrolase [bacterium]|nr:MBL fold metallo-hydrolase [bacterium]